jgi:hypothetical protein
MRILLDQCVPERLRDHFPGHDCQTARYRGLASLRNGALLAAAEEAHFDVLLTVDQGIPYQQNLEGRRIALLVIVSKSTILRDLLSFVPACLEALKTIQPGQVVEVSSEA